MKDTSKTKEQLISEVNKLRRQIDDLYKSKPDIVSEVWTGDHDEKLNRAIVEQSPLGISIRNSKGKLLGVNKSWKKIWGVPQKTIDKYLASEPVELAFDEKDSYLDEWLPQIKNIYKKGGMLNIPLLYLGNHRSAKPRWVSQTFYAVKDSNGSVDRVVILTEDITDRKSVEEALHSSNERFKDLVELLPEAIFETDRDMNLTFANRRAFELFGYTNEDIKQGLSAFELVVPEDRDRAKTNFAKRIKGDDTGTSEYMALKKDGSVFPILFNAQSILKESELFGLKGIVVDITERRRIEEELRISEERYKNIFDNALVGLFRTRLSDGMFIALNSVNAKQLNLPIDEIIGKKRAIDLYVNPDQREELIAILKRDGEAHDFETNMTLHDGSNGTFSISVKAYPEKDYMEGAVINITERKRAEKSLKKSEEKYRTLLSNIPDVVWTTDNIGKTTFISPNVEEVYGYTPNEIYEHDEKLWFGRIHPDHRENVKKEYAKLYKNKSQLDLEYKIQRKDGQWIWLHDRGIKIFDNNGIAHVDGIFSDITKRKHAEDALLMEKERAQGYLDIAGSMLLALDSKGKMILLNKKACQILGCSSEDWLGKDWFETFLPKQIRREVSHVYNQLMSGKIEPVEYYENPVLTV
ncbi:MAG: PAS domain S-box protein, partial [candidate division Zixibacteria bacterium]|nr:PAS domain S-box protein [candidate division Zixibacteria bacterium]